MRLLRILGLWFGLAVTVGNTIGGGILRTPASIAQWLPHGTFFVGIWLIGALYALLGANALSELGTMLPRSGGQFVFARHAFGDYAGFVVGWMDWISTCASTAAISVVLAESVASVIGRPAASAPLIATAIVVAFTALLLAGTSIGDGAQRVTSLLKALALLALIAACFIAGGSATVTAVAAPAAGPPAAGVATGFAAFLLAAQAVIYTYDGWSAPIYFSEELRDPDREIPRSMFIGLATVALIYVLINLAFLRAVPLRALAASDLPAATVADALFGARGALLVRIVVIVSLPSAINACLLMASRVIFALSRDGLGLAGLAATKPGGTPVTALVAGGAVTVAFLQSGTFNQIIAVAAFFFVATYALSFLVVFVLRRREPAAPRPYRAVGHPWTTGFVLLGSLGFLVSAVAADRRNSLAALAMLAASYPVFRLMRRPVPVASADPYLSE